MRDLDASLQVEAPAHLDERKALVEAHRAERRLDEIELCLAFAGPEQGRADAASLVRGG